MLTVPLAACAATVPAAAHSKAATTAPGKGPADRPSPAASGAGSGSSGAVVPAASPGNGNANGNAGGGAQGGTPANQGAAQSGPSNDAPAAGAAQGANPNASGGSPSSPKQADIFSASGACSVSDVSISSTACFGLVTPGPVNASQTLLNTASFGGLTGLFGHTDWTFLSKFESGQSSPGLLGLTVGPDLDPGKGIRHPWSVQPGTFDTVLRSLVIVKQSNTFSAYLYEGSSLPTSGFFTAAAFDKNMGDYSHLSLYSSGVREPVAPVPLPGSVALLMTALGGSAGLLRVARQRSPTSRHPG